jgi:hypothetical protein
MEAWVEAGRVRVKAHLETGIGRRHRRLRHSMVRGGRSLVRGGRSERTLTRHRHRLDRLMLRVVLLELLLRNLRCQSLLHRVRIVSHPTSLGNSMGRHHRLRVRVDTRRSCGALGSIRPTDMSLNVGVWVRDRMRIRAVGRVGRSRNKARCRGLKRWGGKVVSLGGSKSRAHGRRRWQAHGGKPVGGMSFGAVVIRGHLHGRVRRGAGHVSRR